MRSYFTNPLSLLEKLDLKPQGVSFSTQAATQFNFKVPESFVNKIHPNDSNDPLLRQILPIAQELELHDAYQKDPLNEADALSQPGLLQKYHGRALLLVTPTCAINCRYCFRRHYPYDDKGHLWKQIDNNIALIHKNLSIEEVILSGGDPLSLSDNKIAELVEKLEQVSHIKRIRIHTRFPIVDPQRVTKKLINILSQSKLKIIMVLHINHAQEIGSDNQKVIAELSRHNILLFNQSVLLKGVNDKLETLIQLSKTLIENQIVPYYLHMLDKVQGSAHFEVSDEKALALYQQLREKLPGYMLPELVREIAGEKSKLPIF